MDFGCAILLLSVCGAGLLQLLRQVREEFGDISEKSDNLLR